MTPGRTVVTGTVVTGTEVTGTEVTGTVVTGVGLAVVGLADLRGLLEPGPAVDGDVEPRGRGLRHKDRASRLALGAVARALRDAGLATDTDADSPAVRRAAVVVSSNFGNLDTVCDFTDTIAAETVTGISPMRVPHMSSNVTACWVAQEHGMRGPNVTLCNGTTGGLDAVFCARNLIAAGRVDLAVVVGVEPDTKAVARLHRESGASRWLDGAVAITVESGAHAAARGVAARALVGGFGRAPRRADAVEAARRSDPRPVELWLSSPGVGTPLVDLTARLGRCSGALGVLQCAAAVARFDQAGSGPILAVAGSGPGGDDSGIERSKIDRIDVYDHADAEGDPSGTAALLLTAPGARAPEGSLE